MKRRHSGFTLVELVVATAIFFIMSAMLYVMLNGVRQQLVFSEEAGDALRELHYAMRRMALDISQLQPRPIRDEVGSGWQNAISAGSGNNSIEFSIGGWRNPMLLPRGSIQRVAYVVDGDTLARLHWPVLDRTLATEPLRTDLLAGISNLQVRFLDRNGEWSEQWPPLGNEQDGARLRPRAVEVYLEHEQWGEITRVIEITG